MILMPDLFSFAYVPNWYSQLDMLAEMALPEPWRFKNPIYLTKNPDTPILERYIHAIFKKQLIDYKDERNPSSAADYFHIENEFCCFHTGLYPNLPLAFSVRQGFYRTPYGAERGFLFPSQNKTFGLFQSTQPFVFELRKDPAVPFSKERNTGNLQRRYIRPEACYGQSPAHLQVPPLSYT